MEALHHATKAAYHRYTQHGGGRYERSPLLQTFEHWYRIIHRFQNNEDLEKSDKLVHLTNEDAMAARRERSINSSASAHWEEWRSNCTRQGFRWVPNVSEDQHVDIHEHVANVIN